jgi:hypothetical protein
MISLANETANTNLQNIFKNNLSVRSSVACTIEYNMNSMLDNISAVYASGLEAKYVTDPNGQVNTYKILFPIDSVIKPFRPKNSGVKYLTLVPGDTPSNSFSSFRTLDYPTTQPRIYYPGITTAYKYWVTPIGEGVDLTVNYSDGITKHALTNKIIIKFEKNHTLPIKYSVTVTPKTGSAVLYGPFDPPADGVCTLYYNGSAWTAPAPSEPVSYADPQEIKSIKLTSPNPSSSGIIGVIELSARWIKDISSDIESFTLSKESSSVQDDILPVGTATANDCSVNLTNYNQTALKYADYLRTDSSFNKDLVYLVKDAEINLYTNIIHDAGSITSGSIKYDKIKQGTFYINTYDISTFGETTINCLDGAQYLANTVAPEILCESYPVTSILRRLLDSIGFTNYKFNILSTSSNGVTTVTDKSIPQLDYFWTDGTTTVWQVIQELCRDIQMNAVFDENDVLNFYTRDYMYSRTNVDWTFYQDSSGSRKPDIIDFNMKQNPSANQVQIIWKAPTRSDQLGTSGPLWEAPTSFLAAGGLVDSLTATSETFILDMNTIDLYSRYQSAFNFNGFFLINSEIIEYDAIEYQYQALSDGLTKTVWIESQSDINKYRYLSKVGYEDPTNPSSAYFRPTGKYRVKKDITDKLVGRGAFGTLAADHSSPAATASTSAGWKGLNISSVGPAFTYTNPSSFSASQYAFIYNPVVNQVSATSVVITVTTGFSSLNPAAQPDQYIVKYQKLLFNGAVDITQSEVTMSPFTQQPFNITGLIAGGHYRFSISSYKEGVLGNTVTIQNYALALETATGKIISQSSDPTVILPGKTYMSINNSTANYQKNKYAMSVRAFDSVSLPSSSSITGPDANVPFKSYDKKTYSFGTSMYLNNDINNMGQGGGFGFFVNPINGDGYYLLLETTSAYKSLTKNPVKIVRYSGGVPKSLKDSQMRPETTFDLVTGGTQYNIDIKVLINGMRVKIDAYINGFKISATDIADFTLKAGSVGTYQILPPTKTISLMCMKGTSAFNYAYASDITQTQYDDSEYNLNFYQGQFSNDLISTNYGNVTYLAEYKDANGNFLKDEISSKKSAVYEFGTIAREIYAAKAKFTSPSAPILWSTGTNKFAKLIGSKMSPFGAEAYVLNNSMTTVPLDDGDTTSFFIFGNTIGQSGDIKYISNEIPDNVIPYPVIFQSRWLQNLNDVEALGKWVKEKVSIANKIVKMKIFGNPLISVGDIVSINYSYQGFDGTQKLIITSVVHSYADGLETSVSCRTL